MVVILAVWLILNVDLCLFPLIKKFHLDPRLDTIPIIWGSRKVTAKALGPHCQGSNLSSGTGKLWPQASCLNGFMPRSLICNVGIKIVLTQKLSWEEQSKQEYLRTVLDTQHGVWHSNHSSRCHCDLLLLHRNSVHYSYWRVYSHAPKDGWCLNSLKWMNQFKKCFLFLPWGG